MNEQARRIIEKHTKLMGFQEGLLVAFYLDCNCWCCDFSYKRNHRAAIIHVKADTIEELLDAVEAEIDKCLAKEVEG